MTGQARRSLVFGAWCAGVGLLFGAVIGVWVTGEAGRWFFVAATLAAFVCGSALWRVVPECKSSRRPGAGALAGGLAGLVSHYVTWYFWCVAGSLGEPPADLLWAFWGAAGLTFYSVIVCGWVTVPVGSALGWFFAHKTVAEG